MARIRTVKPEFWIDERVGECSPTARLLFIATWNFADDNGNLERSSRQLKAQAFPYDSFELEPLLLELMSRGLLAEYEVKGHKYLHISGFDKHQKIEKKSAGKFPLPDSSPTPPRLVGIGREGKGKEGSGGEGSRIVFLIATSYPKSSHYQNELELPPALADAIIQAIEKDGPNAVLAGTCEFAKNIDNPTFAPDPYKFFSQFQYRRKWNRANAGSKFDKFFSDTDAANDEQLGGINDGPRISAGTLEGIPKTV